MNDKFDVNTYKDENDKLKLSKTQKDIITAKMHQTQDGIMYENKKFSHKPKNSYSLWVRTAAAVLAVAVIGCTSYFGFSFGKLNNTENVFTITANAAEVAAAYDLDDSIIGAYSSEAGGGWDMKDFDYIDSKDPLNDNTYFNKEGTVDYFTEYKLSGLQITGKNIDSVTMTANKKCTYFEIMPAMNYQEEENYNEEQTENTGNNDDSWEQELALFSDKDKIKNSRYTRKEFNKYCELSGYVCDGFTYNNPYVTSEEQTVNLDDMLSFIIETDCSDSKIYKWTDRMWEIEKQLLRIRQSHTAADKINGGGKISKEEEKLDEEMFKCWNNIIEKSLKDSAIDVTVKFTDGSSKTQTISVDYYHDGDDEFPWITFSLAEQ